MLQLNLCADVVPIQRKGPGNEVDDTRGVCMQQWVDLAKERKRQLTKARAVQIHKYKQITTESRLFRAPFRRHLTSPSCS